MTFVRFENNVKHLLLLATVIRGFRKNTMIKIEKKKKIKLKEKNLNTKMSNEEYFLKALRIRIISLLSVKLVFEDIFNTTNSQMLIKSLGTDKISLDT